MTTQTPPLAVGWQEIAADYYVVDVHDENQLDTYWPAPERLTYARNAVPLSITAGRFQVLEENWERATEGIPTTPGHLGSPPRLHTWRVYKDSVTGETFWHVNGHKIQKAFTDQPEHRDEWEADEAMLVALVKDLMARWGPNGFITGDFNRPRWEDPTLAALGAHWLWPDTRKSTYDYLITFGASVAKTATRVPLNSDHDAITADIAYHQLVLRIATANIMCNPKMPQAKADADIEKVGSLSPITTDVPVDKMDPKSYFIGAKGDHVVWLSQRLIAHKSTKHHAAGKPYQAGPTFTEVDRLNVADFQKAQGWSGADADGFPGASSLLLLAAAPPRKPTGPKPGTAQAVIGKARLEVGQHEGKTNGTWNNKQKYAGIAGLPNGQAWCDTFVYAMAKLSGCWDLWPQPASPGCDVTGSAWKRLKRWSEFPAVGAQVFFGKPSDLNHTGLVVDYDADFIYTIEGNTNTSGSPQGDGVYARKRGRRDANVIGYGYPAYPGGIKSADPKWPNGAPTPIPTPAPVGTATPVVADISHFQSGSLDFAAAYAAGIRAIVHKITDGTAFVDELYTVRRVECKNEAPKMAWGGYHFARPEKSSGTVQAAFALKRAGKLGKGDVQLVLDLEKTGGLSTGALTTWVGAFVEEAKRQTGALPIIYTPFALGKTFGCRLWVARYSDAMNPPRIPAPWTDKYALWQFTNGVFGHPDSIPGLGHVDLSTLHVGRTVADLLIA